MAKATGAQRKTVAKSTDAAESDVVQTNEQPAKLEVVKEDSPKRQTKKSHYPKGTKLFTYKPKGGGEPIQFPMEFDYPDKVWLWELSLQPFLAQTWLWMKRAGVPKEVQRQAVMLPDDEYPDLFEEWFKAVGGTTLGE